MAFRKRNVAVGRSVTDATTPSNAFQTSQPGVRPSSLTPRPVTSTGTPSLDALLGGHGGLTLGCSLLVEESGTTDFSGALLRYFAAEGICQGHVLHVIGVGEQWIRELPGIAEERTSKSPQPVVEDDKMKIAWRYERISQAGERGALICSLVKTQRTCKQDVGYLLFFYQLTVSTAIPDSSIPALAVAPAPEKPFCHSFDLSKRLTISQDANIHHMRMSLSDPKPFDNIVRKLEDVLKTSSTNTPHRLIMPTVLSPAIYPASASRTDNFIRFLHSLRALLRKYSNALTAMISLPLELYPRNSGLVRWAEILSDGVLELSPFPHLMDASNSLAESGGARSNDDQPQGIFNVQKLPINTECGEGGAGVGNSIGEDLAFTVSRRKFVIKPFSLPPLEGDQDAQKEAGKLTGKDVEF